MPNLQNPTGATYRIQVSKLGHADGWVRGDTIVGDEFPDIDFARLLRIGAVIRTDADAPPAEEADPAPIEGVGPVKIESVEVEPGA